MCPLIGACGVHVASSDCSKRALVSAGTHAVAACVSFTFCLSSVSVLMTA